MVAEGTSVEITQISNGKKVLFLIGMFCMAICLCQAQTSAIGTSTTGQRDVFGNTTTVKDNSGRTTGTSALDKGIYSVIQQQPIERGKLKKNQSNRVAEN